MFEMPGMSSVETPKIKMFKFVRRTEKVEGTIPCPYAHQIHLIG